MGNTTHITNPRGATTVQQYDEMGRMVLQTLPPAGGHSDADQRPATTASAYDSEGNLVGQWDAEGHLTSFSYDARNQLVTLAQPGSESTNVPGQPGMVNVMPITTYSYDAWGNLRATRDALGATVSYQYDLFQQPTRTTYPAPGTLQHEAPVTCFVYDAAGQLLESRESGSHGWRVTNYEYDDLGRLRRESLPADLNGQRPVTEFSYDLRDNQIAVMQSGGRMSVYEFDKLDRPIATSLPDPDGVGPLGVPTTHSEYNVDGSLRSSVLFDSSDPSTVVATHYQYDALGRMVHERSSDPDGVGPLVAPETYYQYDVMGNLTSQTDLIAPEQAVTQDYLLR